MANEKTIVWYRPGKPVKAVRVELTLANMQKLQDTHGELWRNPCTQYKAGEIH